MDIEVEDIALEAQTILHGRFQIREVHYIGEQGITYIGYDKIRKKDVIIKEFMPYRIANRDLDHRSVLCRGSSCKNKFEEFGKAFQKECEYTRMVQDIKKPYSGCTTVYVDDFTENDTWYLVIEKAKGRSLDACVGELPVSQKYRIIRDLLQIIRQIHKRKLLHCDIKPANIIVRPDGHITLIDFGSAARMGSRPHGAVYVSRGYSAPELYQRGKISRATDIYSVGAVIYNMLTGYQLPQAEDIEDIREIPRLSEFVEISGYKEKLFMRMLDKDKKKRLKSVFLLYFTR